MKRLADALTIVAAVLVACGSGEAEPNVSANASAARVASTSDVSTSEVPVLASGPPKETPNRPTFEASARLRPDAPQTSASAALSPAEVAMQSCEPKSPPPGYEDCEAIEVIGGPPCELECWRERTAAKTTDRCCEWPVHGAIFGKNGLLVEADACAHVDPSCADSSSNIRSAEKGFHFYSDSAPREVLLVQGGCEMRAMSHGYVPSGVPAWIGCSVTKRFRWNGTRFAPVP